MGIDADVWVTYFAAGRLMRTLYSDQILTTACSASGDSGAPPHRLRWSDCRNALFGHLANLCVQFP